MKRLIILGALLIAGCGTSTTSTTHHMSAIPNSICHALQGGKFADPKCTPGVIDPRVTQANISRTICVPGYTKTVRPPVSVTDIVKRAQIILYGYTDKSPKSYEEDHLISLELGGAPADSKNLWPEPHTWSFAKDKIENLLHKRICSGALTLSQAQQIISHDWSVQ